MGLLSGACSLRNLKNFYLRIIEKHENNVIVNRKFAQTLEKKFFDATFALALELQQQFPSSDGWIEDLSDMTQGVGITQRLVIE